jgi:hypothetical protein
VRILVLRSFASLLLCVAAVACSAQDQVTILYDAFGESKELTKDWGFRPGGAQRKADPLRHGE